MIRQFFFVTFCTANRRKALANPRVHDAFNSYAQRGLNHNVAVGRYVIMPDHVHLFVAGGSDFDLGLWVRGLKRIVAAAVIGGRDGKDSAAGTAAATTQLAAGLWQRGFFDHLIRSTESYAQKWEYVRNNPVRARLVQSAEEWPFQGEIALIDRV